MRFLIFAAALCAAAPAAADPPDAQSALVERLGLIEIDARCRLLAAGPRTALQAGANQARGALLRAGWTPSRLDQLEAAIVRAAAERACSDQRTQRAVADAREAYSHWAETNYMEFPGWNRDWVARRTTGPNGWRLSQALDTPQGAVFGVREVGGAQRFSLITLGVGATSARLVMRDASRSRVAALDLTTRIAYGLQAGAPGPGTITRAFASTRVQERRIGASGMQTVFTFPDTAFQALMGLDPRESVEIQLVAAGRTQTIYVEVGDIAAARAFLAARAS